MHPLALAAILAIGVSPLLSSTPWHWPVVLGLLAVGGILSVR
jgi:hypothetical protein